MADHSTPNLPSRAFSATAEFWGRMGFAVGYRDEGWMILKRGPMVVEFFPHPELNPRESWFSACLRVDDLDAWFAEWSKLDLSSDPKAMPRLTGIMDRPPVPRMFALVDPDGSLIRVLQNGE